MGAKVVTVLYEDKRGVSQGFGLHTLVKACVFDAINGDRVWIERDALKDCRPYNGDGNLLRGCREDADLIAADGRTIVAVFDDDGVRRLHRRGPGGACRRARAVHQREPERKLRRERRAGDLRRGAPVAARERGGDPHRSAGRLRQARAPRGRRACGRTGGPGEIREAQGQRSARKILSAERAGRASALRYPSLP
jgi:hypothetical protein